jgi:hypothetical protein
MALGTESYCVHHKTVTAVGRCRQCSAPFCNECHVDVAEGDFCSIECRAKSKRFANNSEGRPRRSNRALQQAISLIIGIGIVAVALHFLGVNVPILTDLINGR